MGLTTNTIALESAIERLQSIPKITPIEKGGTGADNAADARTNLGISLESLGGFKMELLSETAIKGSSTSSNAHAQIGTLSLQGDIVAIGVKGTLKGDYLMLGGDGSDTENTIMGMKYGGTITYSDYKYYFLLRHADMYIPLINFFSISANPLSVPTSCPLWVWWNGYDDYDRPTGITSFNGTIRVYGGNLL